MFELDEEQQEKFKEWNMSHHCELKEYSGAIGGRLTFSFTPTSLGLITKVSCGCGEEINLTDFEEW